MAVHFSVLLLALALLCNLVHLALRRRRAVVGVAAERRRVTLSVVATGDGLRCVASAFATKDAGTSLRVLLSTYASAREVVGELRAHKSAVTVHERSLRDFLSETDDRERHRRAADPGATFVEVHEHCEFALGWDLRIEADLAMLPRGAVLTTMPSSRDFAPTFACIGESDRVVARRMDHEPPRPVPSLVWCGSFACSASPWHSEYEDSPRGASTDGAHTAHMLQAGVPMFAPRRCPVRFVAGAPPLASRRFRLPPDAPAHVAALCLGERARARLGLSRDADDAELIAKFGSPQLARNALLRAERAAASAPSSYT